jgi:hypothetical protein
MDTFDEIFLRQKSKLSENYAGTDKQCDFFSSKVSMDIFRGKFY